MYADIGAFAEQIDRAHWGTAYYFAVLSVPAIALVHIMTFAHLLQQSNPRQLATKIFAVRFWVDQFDNLLVKPVQMHKARQIQSF